MGSIGSIRNPNGSILFKMYASHADARRQAFRIHYHTEIELSLILSGSGTYNSEGKLYPVVAGDIFFYKSGIQHCITDIADGGMDILNIHISPAYLHLIRSESAPVHFGRDFLRRSFPTVKLTDALSAKEAELIRSLFCSLRSELTEKSNAFELIAESYLTQMLVILSRKMPPPEERISAESSDVIFRALEFMDSHYTEDISLQSISEFARLEKTYFAALFKKTMGTNPWEYILIKRIDRAIKLLRTTSSTVLEIAGQTGFNNTANFNKIFKKYTGMTPKELRSLSAKRE